MIATAKPKQGRKDLKVLAIDPGFSNLGVTVAVADEADYHKVVKTILFSDTLSLGSQKTYRQFHKRLLPTLESLWDNYGPFDVMTAEEPTLIRGKSVISCYLWYVYGMIRAWIQTKGVDPEDMYANTPMQLKDVARLLMRRHMEKRPSGNSPNKAEISDLLSTMGVPIARSSHENDATLSIIAALGRRVA